MFLQGLCRQRAHDGWRRDPPQPELSYGSGQGCRLTNRYFIGRHRRRSWDRHSGWGRCRFRFRRSSSSWDRHSGGGRRRYRRRGRHRPVSYTHLTLPTKA